jgi:dihydrolipoamide dehydrogenase
VHYITSETFFGPDFPDKKPWDSLIMIGGGVIAAEFAHVFSAFGTKVTIVEMLPRLINTEEPEISRIVEQSFKQHMEVLVNTKAIEVREEGNQKILLVEDMKSHQQHELKAEALFISAGRQSNADLLHADKCGIEMDKKGWIKVNSYLETNVPNIWAIGDITGQYQFRHKANYDAEICSNNMFSSKDNRIAVDYSAVPWAIFTDPEVGHVGLTQEQAIAAGYEIFVALKTYSSVAKGFAMGMESGTIDDGLVKLIVNKDYKILGAHIVGPEAALLVQPFVYLMNAGFNCGEPTMESASIIPKDAMACPDAGSFMPIYKSMVIHPSLNEVTGWAIGNLRPVNIKQSGHGHHYHDEN